MMESLIKQTRSRFSSTRPENKEESGSTRDKKIPPQKTQSFREKKRSQSWLRRQLSRQMSWDNDFSSVDYPMAVAAAAYAIQSLEEESKATDHKEATYKSLSKTKSKAKDTEAPPERLKSALKVPDENSKKSFKDSDTKVPISTTTTKKMPEKAIGSVKKRISFADTEEIANSSEPELLPPNEQAPERATTRPSSFSNKDVNVYEGKKPEIAMPKTYHPNAVRPTNTTMSDDAISKGTTKHGPGDSLADAWEKEEMASIKERYEKLRATIDNWETKKKKRAKHKIEKIEAELDKRRVKAMASYRSEITRIQEIASGARTQAEENRRKEELKAKEKATKIRSTGKIPPRCICF